MELFENLFGVPSIMKSGNLITFSAKSFLIFDAFGLLHLLDIPGLHEHSQSVSADAGASHLITNLNVVRSSDNMTSSVNLESFSNLESKTVLGDLHLVMLAISSNAVQAGLLIDEGGLLSVLIEIHSRAKSSKGSQIIMDSAPTVLMFALLILREVVEESSDDVISFSDDVFELVLIVVGAFLSDIFVDVVGELDTGVDDELAKGFEGRLEFWE
mmetsp:Transcript_9810/g.8371  ORF Transcript_9810/g.8371 Transcript_9810/m.8371 type:complete len:214 (-) Transcript_9810:443-1084(-)